MKELECINDLYMNPLALQGRKYKVVSETPEKITIKNEEGRRHHFSKNKEEKSYFGNWFKVD